MLLHIGHLNTVPSLPGILGGRSRDTPETLLNAAYFFDGFVPPEGLDSLFAGAGVSVFAGALDSDFAGEASPEDAAALSPEALSPEPLAEESLFAAAL